MKNVTSQIFKQLLINPNNEVLTLQQKRHFLRGYPHTKTFEPNCFALDNFMP